MNPSTFKLYKSLCSAVMNTSLTFTNIWQRQFIARYIEYVDHLIFTRAPRLSYLEHYCPAYTPLKVKYSAPLCLGLAGTVLIGEYIWTQNTKENARQYFESVRD